MTTNNPVNGDYLPAFRLRSGGLLPMMMVTLVTQVQAMMHVADEHRVAGPREILPPGGLGD